MQAIKSRATKVCGLQAEDIPAVLRISAECGLCLWSAEAYRAELVRSDAIKLGLKHDNVGLTGFAVGRIFDFGDGNRSVELTNIGVRQAMQDQGFGRVLLTSFLERCRLAHAGSVILEVRHSNERAIRFYRRFGFLISGRRKRFYSDPVEDAITMRLSLK